MNRSRDLRDAQIGVDRLKKEAKHWLKQLRVGDVDAIARFKRALPAHSGGTKSLTLRGVQHALARERGYESWLALIASVNARHRALREIADEVLKNAIFKGDHRLAARLYARHPDAAKLDLNIAVAAGDLGEVRRRLAADSGAAARPGGPLNWPPILYLAYSRLPGASERSVEIAHDLLNAGADPNSTWNDDWANPFKVLTGVVALGEGVKPTHERADQLVDLLVERGADPVDSQTFYNISIVDDDVHWLDVLWKHSEQLARTRLWREVSKNLIGGHVNLSPLDFMLSLAVSYGHVQRAEWLLSHGANANAKQAYSGRALRTEALVYGNAEMASLLERHGANAAPLEGIVAFQVACRNLDRDTAERLAAAHPEFLRDAEVMLTAAREGKIELVKLLLELGVDVDVMNSDEIRALNIAAGNGHVDLVKLLIERGADIDRPTTHYGSPLGFAGHFGRRETAELIAPRSRDVHALVFLEMKGRLHELLAAEPALANMRSRHGGITPLFALPDEDKNALEMAKFLLDRGADASIADEDGELPHAAARKRGLDEAADLLQLKIQR